jgi:ATP-dependent RNA helicase RhlE
MTFNELQIIEPILKALINEGYSIPTPIQEQAIPILLQGRDILGCAQTGTGKTAAFSIPIIQKLYENRDVADVNTGRNSKKQRKNIKALVLTPTRELAAQIGDSFSSYGKFTSLKHTVIYGGVRQRSQTDAIRNGVDILVATPGRLLDLVNQGHVNLRHIEFFVLDEADRMLDMGFITDIKRVIDLIPQSRQTLLFSATMPSEISSLAESLLNNPVKVEVTPVEATVDLIDQYLYFADRGNKTPLLIDLLNDDDVESALIFSRTKHGADKLSKSLTRAGINCDAIHGNKSQNARQKSLSDFKRKRTRVLVATDIAARGIDINQISHVINYDLPEAAETYVHRIGRTGRAGYSGVALSFCDSGELGMLKSIQKLIGKDINVIAGHEFECAVCVEKIDRLKKSVAKGKERTGSGSQTAVGTQERTSSNRYKGKRTKGEFWQKGRRRSA